MNKFSTIVTGIVGIFCIVCGIILMTDAPFFRDGILIIILGLVFAAYAVKRWQKLAKAPKREKKAPYDFEANKPQRLKIEDKNK